MPRVKERHLPSAVSLEALSSLERARSTEHPGTWQVPLLGHSRVIPQLNR